MVAAAKLMPEDKLLDELTSALESYKVLRTETSKRKLELFMMMAITRYATSDESLDKTIKRFNEVKQMSDLFKNKEQ